MAEAARFLASDESSWITGVVLDVAGRAVMARWPDGHVQRTRRPLLQPARRSMVVAMRFDSYSFGSITIDGVSYEHDVVIDHGSIARRRKKPSKPFRTRYGHTPLSVQEDIPWSCKRLVVGTGAAGSLPIMDEVLREADRRGIELVAVPTEEAIEMLRGSSSETNAVLHVTC